jgi:hypothetical protein
MFNVDDEVIITNPNLDRPSRGIFRGTHDWQGTKMACIWNGRSQFSVPLEWVSPVEKTTAPCPECGYDNEPAGSLASTDHYTCRACGWWYNA